MVLSFIFSLNEMIFLLKNKDSLYSGSFMIGKTISHYKVLERIGEGWIGVVYKDWDTKLKHPAVLKTRLKRNS